MRDVYHKKGQYTTITLPRKQCKLNWKTDEKMTLLPSGQKNMLEFSMPCTNRLILRRLPAI